MIRVLVTRPEPGASSTARRLEGMGFRPIQLPLTETTALPFDRAGIPSAAAVAVTSANAVHHASKGLVAALAALPCHAVGRRTAQACRAAGFSTVDEGPGDAEALAGAIAARLAGREIVYLCGRVRFAGFEERLAAAGVEVHAIETYDTVELAYDDADMLARLSGSPVEAVLLYSAKAAAALARLIARPAMRRFFETSEFLALSARVAKPLDGIAAPGIRPKIRTALRPDEDALLELLSPPR
jgi:uroporphyrinogen-III synthase